MSKDHKSKGKNSTHKHDDQVDECIKDFDHFALHRDVVIKQEQGVSSALDKSILTLSSASLGLTFAFSQWILGEGALVSQEWLKLSWLLLGASVFFVLISTSLTGVVCHLDRRMCDEIMNNRSMIVSSLSKQSNTPVIERIEFNQRVILRRVILLTHYLSPICLFLGVLSVGIFINYNFGASENAKKTFSAEIRATEWYCDTGESADSPSRTSATANSTPSEKER